MPYVEDGTYAGLLDGPTTVRSEALLTVFNFKGLSDRLVPLVMLPLIEHIWQAIADPAKPVLLILDEGWKLLEHPASARFLTEVARTGRHHGIVSLNLSQFVTDYTGPTGSAVLDNAAVALLLKQHPKLLPHAQQIFGLSDDERQALARLATVKGVHAGAYLHAEEGADSGVVRLWVTPEEYWLCTSHPPEQRLRQAAVARHGGDIWAAVRELAAMTPDQRETLQALDAGQAHAAASGTAQPTCGAGSGELVRRSSETLARAGWAWLCRSGGPAAFRCPAGGGSNGGARAGASPAARPHGRWWWLAGTTSQRRTADDS